MRGDTASAAAGTAAAVGSAAVAAGAGPAEARGRRQGLSLVHQRKHFLWDRGYIKGFFRGFL